MMLKSYYDALGGLLNRTKLISDTVCSRHNGLSHKLTDAKEIWLDLAVAIDFLKRNAKQ